MTASRKTIRVSNLEKTVTDEQFEDIYHQVLKDVIVTENKTPRGLTHLKAIRKLNPSLDSMVRRSFAIQNDSGVATLSFQRSTTKVKVLRKIKAFESPLDHQWVTDDTFEGVTVLSSPVDSDVDIVAVHGLGGNAFDSWTAADGTMWLRDLLPREEPNLAAKSRIMTFGYASDSLGDEEKHTSQWAKNLLQDLDNVRRTETEQKRPIILIGHSFGAKVIREAMGRLGGDPEQYRGLRLDMYGLVVLTTPPQGALSGFFFGIASVAKSVRRDTFHNLKSVQAFLEPGYTSPPRSGSFAEPKKQKIKGTGKLDVAAEVAVVSRSEPLQVQFDRIQTHGGKPKDVVTCLTQLRFQLLHYSETSISGLTALALSHQPSISELPGPVFGSQSTEVVTQSMESGLCSKSSYFDPYMANQSTESLLSQLGDYLVYQIHPALFDNQALDRCLDALPKLLKAFALKMGYSYDDDEHREVISQIAVAFKEKFENLENANKNTNNKNLVGQEGPAVLQSYSNFHASSVAQSLRVGRAYVENKAQDNKGNRAVTQQHPLFSSPDYERLVSKLLRACVMITPGQSAMQSIRQKIIESVSRQVIGSEKNRLERQAFIFGIPWDLPSFVKKQGYDEEPKVVIETALTLTGSADDAQAMPCIQYVAQIWGSSGVCIVRLVKQTIAAQAGIKSLVQLPDNTEVSAWTQDSLLMVRVDGTKDSIAEVGEQIAWLGATFHSSTYEDGVEYCTPSIQELPDNKDATKLSEKASHSSVSAPDITFILNTRRERRDGSSQGRCWHDLFLNPVVVEGYPILRRPEPYLGLELQLNAMANLIEAKFANVFRGKLFLKGFSAMLVPIKRLGNVVVWHLLFHKDGTRITYLESPADHTEHVGLSDLEDSRHIVGWCSNIKTFAGAKDANYDVGRSQLTPSGKKLAISSFALSGGHAPMNASLTLSRQAKRKPIHMQLDAYEQKIRMIHSEFVVLWDEKDERGWLINGASALLHLLRAYSKVVQADTDFRSHFKLDADKIEEPLPTHRPESAIEVLMSESNKKLEITYPGEGEEPATPRLLVDQIETFYNVFEQMIDDQVDAEGQGVFNISLPIGKKLRGWRFTDMISDYRHLDNIETTLHVVGDGWVDFIKTIKAITLFGRGFGELFEPVDTLCDGWQSLPTGKCYLAACVSDLKVIMKKYGGDADDNPPKQTQKIVWHNTANVFGPCGCRQGSKHSDFALCLRPHSSTFTSNPSAQKSPKPKMLDVNASGAVVFGHHNFLHRHQRTNANGAAETPSILVSTESGAQHQVGGIQSCETPTAPRSTENLSITRSQQRAEGGSRSDSSKTAPPSFEGTNISTFPQLKYERQSIFRAIRWPKALVDLVTRKTKRQRRSKTNGSSLIIGENIGPGNGSLQYIGGNKESFWGVLGLSKSKVGVV